MHHKSRFLESVRWTSCTAGIAVSGFRTGWSDFGRFFCALLCGRHQTKNILQSVIFHNNVTWLFRFDLRFCLRYGEFFLFFWVNGQRSPKRNLMGQAYGWRQRTPFRVSEIRIRKNRVFSVSVKRSPPDKRHKAGGKRLNLTVNEVENFQGSGHFEVSEASEESEDSWWPERSTPQQVGSSVFFLGGGNFLKLVFGGPQVVRFFFEAFCHAWQSICKAHWTGP